MIWICYGPTQGRAKWHLVDNVASISGGIITICEQELAPSRITKTSRTRNICQRCGAYAASEKLSGPLEGKTPHKKGKTTMTTKTTKRQGEIKGTERPSIKALDEAATKYVTERDERMRLLQREIDAKATLIQRLHEHEDQLEENGDGALCYQFHDGTRQRMCVLGTEEKLSVKKVAEEASGSMD